MIKVLEHGVRKITCPHCKAKLQYEQEDIQMDDKYPFIICPDCGEEIVLNKKKDYNELNDIDL